MPITPERRVWPTPTGAEGAWIPHALRLENFTCEATFAIETSFYVGPENGNGMLAWEEAHVALPQVTLPRQFSDCVTTAELLGNETALIDYYRQMVTLAERHGKAKSLQSPFPYFRSKPAIIAYGEPITEFDWNDDVGETETILQALVDAGAGEDRLEYLDVEQGWKILIVAKASDTCWIEWDAEGSPPHTGGYSIDRVEAARQAAAALERMHIIHGRLVEALGQDYWTYHPANRASPEDASALKSVAKTSRTIWQAALAFFHR